MKLRNNKAAVQWITAVAFLFFVAAMSLTRIRATGAATDAPVAVWGMLMVCWVACIISLVYTFRQACVLVEVMPDATIVVTWRYPFGRRTRVVQRVDIHSASVIEARDAEGVPYFQTRLALVDGVTIDLAEGRRRNVCTGICARFNEVMRTADSRSAEADAKAV